MKVEQRVVISRPVGEVFALVADLKNWSLWQPALRETQQISRGLIGVGAMFRQTLEVGGQRIELSCEVTEYQTDEKLSFDYSRDGLSFWLGFYFEPVEGGTSISSKGQGRMSGFSSLLEPVIVREVNEHIRTSLDHLKYLLEFQGPDD